MTVPTPRWAVLVAWLFATAVFAAAAVAPRSDARLRWQEQQIATSELLDRSPEQPFDLRPEPYPVGRGCRARGGHLPCIHGYGGRRPDHGGRSGLERDDQWAA